MIYFNASQSGKLKELYGDEFPVPKKTCVMYPAIDIPVIAKEGVFCQRKNKGGVIEPYIGGTVDEYPEREKFM